MRRIIFLTILILCSGWILALARQQNTRNVSIGELRKLLSLPAPPPRVADQAEKPPEKPARPPDFFDPSKPPPEDAPGEDLLDYWQVHSKPGDPQPTEAMRHRLLAALEGEPERLPKMLNLLPQDSASMERVKLLYDKALGDERFDVYWRKSVHEWLRFHSQYFLNDLMICCAA